jgi:xylulokinase
MPAGFVAGRLAGLRGDDAFIDPTYLHFSCLSDTRAGAWSDDLCGIFDVPSAKLARIVEPWEVVGRLTGSAAAHIGLSAGTPIMAGAGDQAAAMLGAGILRPGMIYDAAGTASVCALCVHRFAPDTSSGTLLAARMVPSGLYYLIGYINGGGLNLRWWRELLHAAEGGQRWDYAQLDDLAAVVPAGADGLLFVPHLGGRVTPNQPHLRGAWLGLRWDHGVGHLYRAILEGVAYEYAIYLSIARQLVPDVPFEHVRVVGGGSRSALWNQVKADVLAVRYVQLNLTEAAALGAAILAGYGAGVFSDFASAEALFTRAVRTFEPDADRGRRYDTARRTYRRIVEDAPVWKAVAALSS